MHVLWSNTNLDQRTKTPDFPVRTALARWLNIRASRRETLLTLYQCFLTEPSVRRGKACRRGEHPDRVSKNLSKPKNKAWTIGYCWGSVGGRFRLVKMVGQEGILEALPAASLNSKRTFAISLQLFPSSLINFSLCSSAGVHGVFVRPFLGGGPGSPCSAGLVEDDGSVMAAFVSLRNVEGPGAGAMAGGPGGGPVESRCLFRGFAVCGRGGEACGGGTLLTGGCPAGPAILYPKRSRWSWR